jgi:hypothetical protein
MPTLPSIRDLAIALCDAIRQHAEACNSDDVDQNRIADDARRVTASAIAYTDAIMAEKGGAVSFQEYQTGMNQEYDILLEKAAALEAEHPRSVSLALESRYLVHLEDPDALADLGSSIDWSASGSLQILKGLCERDGWRVAPSLASVLKIEDRDIAVFWEQ